MVFLLLAGLCSWSLAQEADESADSDSAEEHMEAPKPAIYLPIKPAFVLNYGSAGRLRYLKTEVSVRVSNVDAANALRRHLPYVRNNLVLLFSSQTNETVSSQDGKEKLRADALEEIRNVLEVENQIPREDIVEVFFNTFIVQK